MTLDEIKQAVNSGKIVHWSNGGYRVIRSAFTGEYLICFAHNENCIGLTWSDGITLNGNESEFYIEE
jgi:hypothetical protein